MPIEIEGVRYFSAADIHRDVGVPRQTLWRWRKEGKIPQGRRYRDRQIVFTQEEVTAIRGYANRLGPADAGLSTRRSSSTRFRRRRRV